MAFPVRVGLQYLATTKNILDPQKCIEKMNLQVESARKATEETADGTQGAFIKIVTDCEQTWIGDQPDLVRKIEEASSEGWKRSCFPIFCRRK